MISRIGQSFVKRIITRVLRSVSDSEEITPFPAPWLIDWSKRLGLAPESTRYLSQVSRWRSAFRPTRIRTLLVAESHVAEQPDDVRVRVAIPESLISHKRLPNGFCRLVYCLGYGESKLCDPEPISNPGTWQFWDLLGAIASLVDMSLNARCPRRREAGLEERLAWKCRVLSVLRDKGVWLVDASVLGLYGKGRRLVRGSRYRQLVRESFEMFVWPEVVRDHPDVWVIGQGVGKALSSLDMIAPTRVISQPQDRDVKRYRRELQRMAREIASDRKNA